MDHAPRAKGVLNGRAHPGRRVVRGPRDPEHDEAPAVETQHVVDYVSEERAQLVGERGAVRILGHVHERRDVLGGERPWARSKSAVRRGRSHARNLAWGPDTRAPRASLTPSSGPAPLTRRAAPLEGWRRRQQFEDVHPEHVRQVGHRAHLRVPERTLRPREVRRHGQRMEERIRSRGSRARGRRRTHSLHTSNTRPVRAWGLGSDWHVRALHPLGCLGRH